jgi:hypothetical protein
MTFGRIADEIAYAAKAHASPANETLSPPGKTETPKKGDRHARQRSRCRHARAAAPSGHAEQDGARTGVLNTDPG